MTSSIEKLGETKIIPVVAVRGSVVFPHTDSMLSFGRYKSLSAINAAFRSGKVVGVFTQKDSRIKDPNFKDLYNIGTVATISQMMSSDGEVHALVRGQQRIRIEQIITENPYLSAKVRILDDEYKDTDEARALSRKLSDLFKQAINLGKSVEITSVMRMLSGEIDPWEIADCVASTIEVKETEKQMLLETLNVEARLRKAIELLSHELNVLELEKNISEKTHKKFEDQMKKAMLREKKKTIEEELGEEEPAAGDDEVKEYEAKIKKSKMPKGVAKKARKELFRLKKTSPYSPESGYIRNWLDWVTEMPWGITKSRNGVSIKKAQDVLDLDHYGLEEVKERILEYLAVMKLKSAFSKREKNGRNGTKKDDHHPTILCFIGPPGVGKTSIGKSIAKALGREFVRVSLGGIRDEAEIRGHRRTYVGALPGRIIQGIKDAQSRNPVFMLDEIDKVGADFRGDPTSALLEALDPEQNDQFVDHYLDVPFDLSDVFFIATGNILDTIPPALRDRMEIIDFSGYTEEEKYYISEKYLWPKQLRVHGLSKKIKLVKKAARLIISRYTREAGVRELERNLAKICRKVAKKVAEGASEPKEVEVSQVRKYLGAEKFTSLLAERENESGMATGLAVTGAGGEILFIEVGLMPGRGNLQLTGQLGEIMKESAQAAFTWAKSHWKDLGLKENFAGKLDVHIHVPEGAVKKDGPSAGVAITTALVSALTDTKVRKDVGMTGEVTLRGRVMEIGGVKHKVLAGHRAGLKTIIMPKENKKNMEDVPENIKKSMDFVFASQVDDVLKRALISWPLKKRVVKRKKSTNGKRNIPHHIFAQL